MHKIALTFACIACASIRPQAHMPTENVHHSPCGDSLNPLNVVCELLRSVAEQSQPSRQQRIGTCTFDSLRAVATLLLAADPASAFRPPAARRHLHLGQHGWFNSCQVGCNRRVLLGDGLLVMMGVGDELAPKADLLEKESGATRSEQSRTYQCLCNAAVIDPRDGSTSSPLQNFDSRKKLVVVLPQLGEFDSSEFCEHLVAVDEELSQASIDLLVIGIGDVAAAKRFSRFTGLDLSKLRVDPEASLHAALALHDGPGWSVPDFISDSVLGFLLSTLPGGKPDKEGLIRPWFDAWLNYLAMCAGIAAPGTLPEILRGYFGDTSAPERLAPDAIVTAGPVEIGPGVGPVKLGPIRYKNGWAEKVGYQRPVELATVRLRNMVEVLGNWDEYVSDPRHIAMRGATYLFDADGKSLYEYRHRGVLTYSNTMSRPLTFLAPYIGVRALNPLGLGDMSLASTSA